MYAERVDRRPFQGKVTPRLAPSPHLTKPRPGAQRDTQVARTCLSFKMASDPYMQGVLEDDLAIYQFDSLGQDSDLAHLLDDTDNDLNDETFGGPADGSAANRDFDFAGSTSRFLGTDDAPPHQAPAYGNRKELVPLSSDWGADPLLSSTKPTSSSTSSPWTSLNDDPLLSRAPASSAYAAVPSPAAALAPQQPSRQVKTLEEVEAEMRAQSAAARQQASAAAQPQPTAPAEQQQSGASRPMTVEEVEAEMLRRRQAESQQPPTGLQQQQQPVTAQLPPGMSPQLQAAFPPGIGPGAPPLPPMFFGNLPPQVLQTLPPQFPTLPPHIQHQLVAQRMAAFGHQLPPPPAGAGAGPGMVGPGPNGAPFSPGMASPSPRIMTPVQGLQHGGSPVPPQHLVGGMQRMDLAQGHPGPGPGTPGPGFPPLGAQMPPPQNAGGEPNLMATLFPPLPSQPGTIANVEQQLEVLAKIGPAQQHPSLMGAQLHALLQNAHAAAAAVNKDATDGSDAPEGDADAALKRQKAEELVRAVEQRIFEYEEAEQKRKRKAMKIASMVRAH